jgi:hypothetical protein
MNCPQRPQNDAMSDCWQIDIWTKLEWLAMGLLGVACSEKYAAMMADSAANAKRRKTPTP